MANGSSGAPSGATPVVPLASGSTAREIAPLRYPDNQCETNERNTDAREHPEGGREGGRGPRRENVLSEGNSVRNVDRGSECLEKVRAATARHLHSYKEEKEIN